MNRCTQECNQGRACTCRDFPPQEDYPHQKHNFELGLLCGLILGGSIACAIVLYFLRTPYAAA